MARAGMVLGWFATVLAIPKYHGCLDNVSKSLPYCDTWLSHESRVKDVLGRLSIDEKVNLLSPHDAPHYCGCTTSPVERIGLPDWHWLTEVNTNAGFCSAKGGCATVFVGPNNFAASFNRSLWYLKGDVVSTEMRAHNNNGDGDIALSGFGPNINLVKDPRYGRNSELVGEDPYLSGSYAISYLRGMQQTSPQGHLKMLAYVKHYTAYSKEQGRFYWKANVSKFDFFDSFLPQYRMAFQEGNASGAMCSYFAANGVPSCGSNWLMNELVRDQWNRPDAVFMSDCSAVANFLKNGFAQNETDASAKALNAGLDVYGGWGDKLWTDGYLHKAINAGLTSEAILDKAVMRTLMQKMKVGVFDPLEEQEWVDLGSESLNSSFAQQVAFEAGLQGLVLLKNAGVLPLQRGINLAVVGPMALETDGLRSDYAKWTAPSLPDSIAAALERSNVGGRTLVKGGVEVDGKNASGIQEAVEAARAADVTVLVLGLTPDQEHEGMDRADTHLPGLQLDFGMQVLEAAKGPVVLVLCNGGMVSVDQLLDGASSVVEAFNPLDHGTRALAETFFGTNRWGKLPYTIYNQNYTAELDAADAGISDYSMAKGPGRSYRYYTGEPLFRFGHGLSYTTFQFECSRQHELSFHCTVTNTGKVAGDEVLLVYHRAGDEIRSEVSREHPVPLQQLVQFDRVSLNPQETKSLQFDLEETAFMLTRSDGSHHLYPGTHELLFSTGSAPDLVVQVELNGGGPEPVAFV